MIVVTGKVQTTVAHRAELLTVANRMCERSRAEHGCIDYRFYEDTARADHFVFLEEWESQEALDRHFREGHTAEFMGDVGGLVEGPADVSFHTVASTKRLGRGNRIE